MKIPKCNECICFAICKAHIFSVNNEISRRYGPQICFLEKRCSIMSTFISLTDHSKSSTGDVIPGDLLLRNKVRAMFGLESFKQEGVHGKQHG